VTLTHQEIFERHVVSSIGRDPDAYAAMFTEDGVLELPMLPPDHPLPRRMQGRDAIRAGTTAIQQVPAYEGTVNFAQSAYVLHETADPDVFLVELDTVFDEASGRSTTMSLVKIFRIRDGQIASLRDYFTPPAVLADHVPGAQ